MNRFAHARDVARMEWCDRLSNATLVAVYLRGLGIDV